MADRNLKYFYEFIGNQGGLRFAHQFLVKLNFPKDYPWTDQEENNKILSIYGDEYLDDLSDANPDPDLDISFFAQSTKIPDVTLNTTTVSYLAAGFVFPGVVKYPEDWEMQILIDSNLKIYKRLLFWKELMSSYATNTGGNKTIPNVDGIVYLLDNYMQRAVRQFKIKGIFIRQLGQLQMEYKEGSNEIQRCALKFAMQWFEQKVTNTTVDQLEILADIDEIKKAFKSPGKLL